MKKLILTTALLLSFSVSAQAGKLENGKFYEDVMISDDIKMEESSESAKEKASNLLNQKPKTIKIEGEPLQFRSSRRKNAPTVISKPIDTTTKYGEAPFGMSWGATYNQTKALGVDMERVERKDSTNNFSVEKLPKPIPDFRQVIVSFGDDNSLWRLSAYGKLLDDNASADKAMLLYRRYHKLLAQKYGNAKEYFTPKITVVEKKVKDEYGVDKIEIEKIPEPIGGANFLAELQSGEAVLYSTFEDQDVGAALAVRVDENGKSYIIIDYTNLRIFREREAKMLDAL